MAPPRNKLILNVDLVSPWSLVGLTVARRYVQQWNLDLVSSGFTLSDLGDL